MDQEILLSGGMIVDVMLGLLLSLKSFMMNRHHAGREMPEALHESKLNRPQRGLCGDACTKLHSCTLRGRGLAQSSLEMKLFHGA